MTWRKNFSSWLGESYGSFVMERITLASVKKLSALMLSQQVSTGVIIMYPLIVSSFVELGQAFSHSLISASCIHIFAGQLQDFINVISSRISVGNDDQGRLVIVAIDGRTYERGSVFL